MNIRVIGGLAHVDVVIRVYRFLATQSTTQHFDGAVRNDFLHRLVL